MRLATNRTFGRAGSPPSIQAIAVCTLQTAIDSQLAGYVNSQILAKGATHVVVITLPDVSLTPYAISAGPVRTLAAKGIPGFADMETVIEERSPLGRNISAADVGNAALYLCSPLGSMVTGTTLYVDSGYHAMGM